jgi:hypothetical protein
VIGAGSNRYPEGGRIPSSHSRRYPGPASRPPPARTTPCAVGWRRRSVRGREDPSVNSPWTVVTGRTRSDTAGHTRTAPDLRFRWSRAVHPGCGG